MPQLQELLPGPPDWQIPWEKAETLLGSLADRMGRTPQEPKWHGEGDVLTHTRLVCEALVRMEDFRKADSDARQTLFLAALLHDVGKTVTTVREGGCWVSPGHARVGAEMARRLLWQDLGLCGSDGAQGLREAVCGLIRYHTMPLHVIHDEDGFRKLRKAAAEGELAQGFHIHGLCLLAQADVLGRVCEDREELLENIQLCLDLAGEAGCLNGPFAFPSDHTAFAYLSGKNVAAEFELYDDSWGEVILMSGLPGTGKDTWIRSHYPDIPMLSLDELRKELGISPMANQSPVLDAARERAKIYLRQKQPFVWNATNILPQTRAKQVALFSSYGASTRIVYLETDWETQLQRNAGRKDAVPEEAITRMLDKLVPPQRWEAQAVEWHCV